MKPPTFFGQAMKKGWPMGKASDQSFWHQTRGNWSILVERHERELRSEPVFYWVASASIVTHGRGEHRVVTITGPRQRKTHNALRGLERDIKHVGMSLGVFTERGY